MSEVSYPDMANKTIDKNKINTEAKDNRIVNGRGVISTSLLGFLYAFVCGVFFMMLISGNRLYPWYVEIILIISIHLYIITRPKNILK